MENPNEKNQSGGQSPPPYSNQQYAPVGGPNPSMGYGVAPGQGPITQPPQHTIFLVPVQPTHEPDYLVYSIFTMLCCCLPLGIAALVYSIQTRDANNTGNAVVAQQKSRTARNLAHSALGIGLVCIIIYIILVVVAKSK